MAETGLDNPDYARFAWHRFRALMGWMVLASVTTAAAGLALLHLMIGDIPLHMAIATGIGTFVTVLLAATLMSLVFLSHGSGHDAAIDDPFEDLNP